MSDMAEYFSEQSELIALETYGLHFSDLPPSTQHDIACQVEAEFADREAAMSDYLHDQWLEQQTEDEKDRTQADEELLAWDIGSEEHS